MVFDTLLSSKRLHQRCPGLSCFRKHLSNDETWISPFELGQQSPLLIVIGFAVADSQWQIIPRGFQRWLCSWLKINDVAGRRVHVRGRVSASRQQRSRLEVAKWRFHGKQWKQEIVQTWLQSFSRRFFFSKNFIKFSFTKVTYWHQQHSKSISGEFKKAFRAYFNDYRNFPAIRIRFVNENLFPTWFDFSRSHVSTLPGRFRKPFFLVL